MCTVTYIPLDSGNYLFSTSRDEHRDRPDPLPPKKYEMGEVDVYYPKDPVAGGTWILSSPSLTLCILNGAFQPHKRTPPYRESRGHIPLRFIEFGNSTEFLKNYQFQGIEAFTLIIIADGEGAIEEIRWDQKKIHHRKMPANKPALWASAPLYNSDMQKMRSHWFNTFLDEYPHPEVEDIFSFYTDFGNGDPHCGLIIDRENGVQTGSICCIERIQPIKKMHYWERGIHFTQ